MIVQNVSANFDIPSEYLEKASAEDASDPSVRRAVSRS